MKTIGILGGMSWESTALYYRGLNEGVKARRGGLHSAPIIMASVDFAEIAAMQADGRWDEAGATLAAAARRLQDAGADFIILATNTMHRVAPAIIAALDVPFIHLADATAARIVKAGINRIGLLATVYTMEQDFYTGRLRTAGLEVLTPPAEQRRAVNRIIYDELCRGVTTDESRALYRAAAEEMFARGAQGLILGCTEITMLIGPDDFKQPVFDTTRIHIEEALERATLT